MYESKTGGVSKQTGPYFLIFTVSASSPRLHVVSEPDWLGGTVNERG